MAGPFYIDEFRPAPTGYFDPPRWFQVLTVGFTRSRYRDAIIKLTSEGIAVSGLNSEAMTVPGLQDETLTVGA